ncbi:helitron helicase-like domain-containing protein [Nonomuraea aurantiaca]|uniref:helitron helicase-like domain-containing protein n=1 Tax=Nonomuraea aurantiaca TaxID=2878562 RepID=UPI001CD93B12|nr:helitron helicase-like domain-containing protein [Nonomuraea aurantiaca]MCA2229012.1 helitron helicase-like domain-containing protein [Nonomuraea aurantiaca]
MAGATDRATPRALRMARPLAREVAVEVAKQHGVCIRPVPLKRLDTHTGQWELVDAPCGATLEAKCPPCAKRNRQLRMAQCREGWHLDHEPAITPDEPNDGQRWLIEFRADAQAQRDEAASAGEDTADWDAAIAGIDTEINEAGMRGNVLGRTAAKRNRSTRRRQDAPDLPKRAMTETTLGRTFTSSNGKTYRPSLFLTLTLPSYGKVRNGVPVDPDTYDYARAARDALHFAKLVDRFVQNLRRVAGYDVQYFAAVEPQKRLAPHLHMAIRGTLPRAEIKQIAAATYHQVWWPAADDVVFDGEHLPVWEDGVGYLDPATGEVLPTWDQALDQTAEPLHVSRFGVQVDVQGVLAGTPDADQCIRYLSKYLTKSISDSLNPDDQAQKDHAARMGEALRFEPCSPTCPNWLRYGVQPKDAKPGMTPGRCRGKAHKPDHLGYAGRRVLVSRKWSNKTLAEHKQDRRTWVLEALGQSNQPADPHRYVWKPVPAGDANVAPLAVRLLRSVAERQRWRAHMAQLQAQADGQDLSATEQSGRAA